MNFLFVKLLKKCVFSDNISRCKKIDMYTFYSNGRHKKAGSNHFQLLIERLC